MAQPAGGGPPAADRRSGTDGTAPVKQAGEPAACLAPLPASASRSVWMAHGRSLA